MFNKQSMLTKCQLVYSVYEAQHDTPYNKTENFQLSVAHIRHGTPMC